MCATLLVRAADFLFRLATALALPERHRLSISPTSAPCHTRTCFAIFWGRQDAILAAIAYILVAHEKTSIAVPVWNGRRHLDVLRP
ncbi:hypothetical protein [Agrobacterium cavarae]|uniref:hypothetical protein n=1 Tax=Agrobacterium cavarae TaxID=2528239 RepID=UPI0028A85945|nr:hypothetical protein [Agrobacterium cavarae]